MKKKYKIVLVIASVYIIGTIAFIYWVKNEIKHTLKRYIPETNETWSFEYILRGNDTIIQGKCISYNEKGSKVSECNFENNHIKGKSVVYNNNGNIESIRYIIDKKRDAEVLWNYPNGKIRKYAFNDYFGECMLIVNYDKNGVVSNYKGNPQLETYQYRFSHKKEYNIKEDQHLKVGDKLNYSYIVANIPNTKRSFRIENIGIDNTKVKRTVTTKPPTIINVEEVLTKKGKNTIRSIVQYKFNDEVTPVFTDTLSFDVYVN
jgi:antitoxin component YwqK of YwqJK toxin-antitoxin module